MNEWYQEREEWTRIRARMEREDFENWKHWQNGFWVYRVKHQAVLMFGRMLKAVGLFRIGFQNAQNIHIRNLDVSVPALPSAFEGYRILHLSDLHLDSISGIAEIIAEKVTTVGYDLSLITGDFRYDRHGDHQSILSPLKTVITAIRAKDGVYAVLGNHDTAVMGPDLERLGIQLLANQGAEIFQNNEKLLIVGVDDPHDYHTPAGDRCLRESGNGFKILMAHSPELYKAAAENGFQLYVCGHSHGGQICLPGGRALMTFLNVGRQFYRGLWQYRGMTGHTSTGCSTAKIPIRFNCPPEVTVLTLRRSL